LGTEALRRAGYDLSKYPAEYVAAALATCKGKLKRFGELGTYAGFYFTNEIKIDPALAAKEFTSENKARLQKLRDGFEKLAEFNATGIEQTLKAIAKELGVKVGVLVHPTRLACTGAASGPSLYHLIEVLGKKTVLERIDTARD
jgi:glutamyl/glutaminyl-tRNA synthetase